MTFTIQQLAVFKGVHYNTMRRYIGTIVLDGKFKKRSPGRFYSEREAQQVAELLDFHVPKTNGKL